jgi:transcription initiation factor TFIIB
VLRDELIDKKPEWRAFTLAETAARRRVGPPTTLIKYDKGLATTFRPYDKHLPLKTRLTMQRLRKWNIRARLHTSVERNLSQAMNELVRLADRLKIPRTVSETAAAIYRKALTDRLVRGRSIAAVAAASLYAACRMTRTPRTLRDVAGASLRTQKEISRCYRLILRDIKPIVPIDDPLKYVAQIASKLNLNQSLQNNAVAILREARQKKVTAGKGPVGIAAAAIYVSSRLHRMELTQRELADVAGVTEVTIRNRYKGLLQNLDSLQGLQR